MLWAACCFVFIVPLHAGAVLVRCEFSATQFWCNVTGRIFCNLCTVIIWLERDLLILLSCARSGGAQHVVCWPAVIRHVWYSRIDSAYCVVISI